MNNKLPIVAVVVIALMAIGYLVMNGSGNMMSDEVMVSSGDSEEVIAGKMADLIKMGKDYSCTYTSTTEDGENHGGTVYVAEQGTMFRGDFVSPDPESGEPMTAHAIRNGETTYFWTDDDSTPGFMYTQSEEDFLMMQKDIDQSSDEDGINPLESDDEVEFICKGWNPDSAIFTPPADKEFMDASAQMEVMNDQVGNMMDGDSLPELDCSVCDQVPAGEARNQCLESFNC